MGPFTGRASHLLASKPPETKTGSQTSEPSRVQCETSEILGAYCLSCTSACNESQVQQIVKNIPTQKALLRWPGAFAEWLRTMD